MSDVREVIHSEHDEEAGFTVEENILLNRMAAGELDGFVGEPQYNSEGESEWLVVQAGIPTKYFESPTLKLMNEGNIVQIPGDMTCVEKWSSEEEKLQFLRYYGELMRDPAVQAYAVKERDKPWLIATLKQDRKEPVHVYPFMAGLLLQ